jgi:predicted nuclease of predicted toxin-antitoxin system
VRPLDFPLLTEENITADVVAGFRARGCDVRPAEEERLIGRGDSEVLERATALHRVVVTHDLAFGKVEIRGGASFVGIVYLRPGHISAAFVQLEISAV